MKPLHSKPMRVLSIALITLASTTSLWAQGQISEFQSASLEASRATSEGVLTFSPLPPIPTDTENSSGVEMIEAYRREGLIDLSVQPLLPPTPVAASFQPQASSLTIQAVPEPSTVALGGMALGLFAIWRVIHKSRPTAF